MQANRHLVGCACGRYLASPNPVQARPLDGAQLLNAGAAAVQEDEAGVSWPTFFLSAVLVAMFLSRVLKAFRLVLNWSR